jgi:hypothetical protein
VWRTGAADSRKFFFLCAPRAAVIFSKLIEPVFKERRCDGHVVTRQLYGHSGADTAGRRRNQNRVTAIDGTSTNKDDAGWESAFALTGVGRRLDRSNRAARRASKGSFFWCAFHLVAVIYGSSCTARVALFTDHHK